MKALNLDLNFSFKFIFPFAISMALFSCAGVITQPDWRFIQTMGGLNVSELEMVDGEYYVPVNLNVGSFKRGTKSEMVCTHTSVRVAGKQLLLRIKTDSKRNVPSASAQCPKAKLGLVPDGDYRVIFIDANGKQQVVGNVLANLAQG